MKCRAVVRHLAAIAMLGFVTTDVTSAWARTRICQGIVQTWFNRSDCLHPVTRKLVAFSVGSEGAGRNDRYTVLAAGGGGGLANVQLITASVTAFDANGSIVADCRPSISNPAGGLVNFFGLSAPACDRGVTHRVAASFIE